MGHLRYGKNQTWLTVYHVIAVAEIVLVRFAGKDENENLRSLAFEKVSTVSRTIEYRCKRHRSNRCDYAIFCRLTFS
eukprot:COSAG06_NODE_554_length_14368_cov_4.951714_5_plen_77_part_00